MWITWTKFASSLVNRNISEPYLSTSGLAGSNPVTKTEEQNLDAIEKPCRSESCEHVAQTGNSMYFVSQVIADHSAYMGSQAVTDAVDFEGRSSVIGEMRVKLSSTLSNQFGITEGG